MTRKERLIRMILSKRLKKYGGVLTPRGEYGTLRKPIKFAGLLQAQFHKTGVPGKDKPGQPSEDITV